MRLALLADIHGNLAALEAVRADLETRHVDRVINLGDCVSGPLWPRETLALLRRLDWPTVRGNHDRFVGQAGALPLSRTDADAAAALDEAGRRWLAALPPRLDPVPGLLAIHARPDDDEAYLAEDILEGRLVPAAPDTVAARLGPETAAVVCSAHSHLAMLMRLADDRQVINPGSVGCPAYHDDTPPAHRSEAGSPDARYAILDLDTAAGPVILRGTAFIALPYDHAAAARRAAALDRPDWAAALTTGVIRRGRG